MSLLEIAFGNTTFTNRENYYRENLQCSQKKKEILYISDVTFTLDIWEPENSHFTVEYSGDMGVEETSQLTLVELANIEFENDFIKNEIIDTMKEMSGVE